MFGGFSRELFGDFRSFDAGDRRWSLIAPAQGDKVRPGPRFGHTMLPYNDKTILLFGGAATYLEAIKMRLCLDDLFLFDVET